ncbi:MAG: 3-dehydroquinate synthase [Candidatus Binatus sp.]|uniref:3-dehydroquinate synthase n=1 Tax=Candidatus Binatus sp. TaxID=2811406 RepID=UPI00271FF294|nr:3-dehydroquinate synthase [Candidatus Binatus sp.]MDO8433565.1 3-dehydroquinate synthase [Candidatus Binatus sp.]
MRTIEIALGASSHSAHVGAGLLDRLGELALDAGLSAGPCAIITDSNVENLYAARAADALRKSGFAPTTISFPAGEASKSAATLETLYDRMTAANLDRNAAIFALGGGVAGDLGGFAAATFLRGVPLVQVPTTVVAQVDSSLGGKTGINHRHAKNLIGAFYQPRLIVADVATLATLPERELLEGLAEVIKYGAIMDAPMIADLERTLDSILARDANVLEDMVARSLAHKAAVVSADEHEGGLRKTLNFGHTIGHAIEASAGYGKYLHGEAVAIGMVAAARLSSRYAGFSADEASRLERLIARAGLPTELPAGWQTDDFMRALKLDKKRVEGAVEFVLLDRLGHSLTRRLTIDEMLSPLG